ncbi:MAG: hypothetical protein KQH59_12980 [Desulfobulbaceae bacterium]|nr:hypothetical protein [Desulfobulbaceae bacterium]
MNITKEKAGQLATTYLIQTIERVVSAHFQNAQVHDSLDGAFYFALTGKPEDYWYIEAPILFGPRIVQTGGDSLFLAINKATGEVFTISTSGE